MRCIEPIPSGNLPPGFDPSTCRSVYVGNIHTQVTESLLQEVFASTGPIEGCKLVRKNKSSYGFVHYFDRRSAALAILSLNGRHLFGQPIKVNWAYASGHREDTSLFCLHLWNEDDSTNIITFSALPFLTDRSASTSYSTYPAPSHHPTFRKDDMKGMLRDAFNMHNSQPYVTENYWQNDVNDSIEMGRIGCDEEPIGEATKFYKLLNEMNEQLYDGSKFSKLSFCIRLFHLKIPRRVDWELLYAIVGVTRRSVSFCKNPSIMEAENVTKDEAQAPSRKKPIKILRYFPLILRLQRLFMSSKIVESIRWHHDSRTNDGLLWHPVDSLAWKSFDNKYPSFARDPQNFRLGLATDRMLKNINFTYGKMNQPSSTRSKKKAKHVNEEVEVDEQTDDEFDEEDDPNEVDLLRKRSMFFELPYWKKQILRHNLDVLHIEKNVCENIIGTILNDGRKSKDNLKSRLDLVEMGIQHDLHPQLHSNGRYFLSPSIFSLLKKEKEVFCTVLNDIKVPDGFLGKLKSYCRNKRYLEGSIAKGYLAEECMTFCSRYLEDVETRWNIPIRNDVLSTDDLPQHYLFGSYGQPLGKVEIAHLDDTSWVQAHRYVLFHHDSIDPFRTNNEESNAPESSEVHETVEEEVEIQVENAGTHKTRGRTTLKELYQLPPRHRVKVSRNDADQPISPEARFLVGYLGIVGRNTNLLPINYESWREMPNSNKNQTLDFVKNDLILEEKLQTIPPRMFRYQWEDAIRFWSSQKGQDLGHVGFASRQHQKFTHKAGSKSFACIANEEEKLREKRVEYHATGSSQCLVNDGDIENRAINDVLGPERYGRVRCQGSFVTPTKYFGFSSSQYMSSQSQSSQLEISRLKQKLAEIDQQMANMKAENEAREATAAQREAE
ncbi:Oligouridylate-binding protein 1B [Hibiscus syriacus]|uniref:Oligouridylate-binding protein 1B n=1 Tax=Hibiscus syriacus TaxID=106335 RepID=A0A6A3BZ67_HIBSY|nr:Oligouridylate-binding protein 1B [Hibiscus syriacus]